MTGTPAKSSKSANHSLQRSSKEYFDEVSSLNMGPLWKVMGELMPNTPQPREVPFQWKWSKIRPLVYESAKVATIDEAVRRVLMLLNPGLPKEKAAVTETLYAGIQIILPGEIAPAHRHTPNALRFVMEGEGAFTTVSGEKTILRKGDVVTTPNWTWHDHGNEASGPVVWLDALDIPVVNSVSGMFYEDFPGKAQEVKDAKNSSKETYGRGLRPVSDIRSPWYSPILNYTYDSAKKAMESMPERSMSPYDGRIVEYINPLGGGPILPTIDAYLQQIAPRTEMKAHRESSSKVVMGVEGSGILEVNGERFDWEPYDVMVIPTWARHRHINKSSKPAVLFSYTNAPVMNALNLYREEEA